MLPDYPMTNELGQAISLGQFKGQALAFTFIFTRCPFP
jgi:protein SCO1/2